MLKYALQWIEMPSKKKKRERRERERTRKIQNEKCSDLFMQEYFNGISITRKKLFAKTLCITHAQSSRAHFV